IRHVTPEDGVNVSDYVKSADYTGEQMYNELYSIAEGFKDEDLKRIVLAILEDERLPLLYWPAAFKLHHAVRGGLLMHTLSIVRLAEGVCTVYPFVDRELLISGAILHDIAKLKEFNVADTGVATGYSNEGNLLGHLAMGAMVINKYAEELNISPKTAMLLEHMVLSHHGDPEFGAAVRPMFIEAELLSELDLMDSRVYEMREAVAATNPEEFSSRIWAMDNRKLFNHTRTDLNNNTKLF
ncbi:MAG TPA: CMP-binding protein, partial [Ruminococcaceae bacterium]|nr:CMP-binding protein [Oscillospiraceae bacterium]